VTLARNCLVFEKIASIQFGDKQTTDAVASTPTPTIRRGLKNHWQLGLCTNPTGRAYSAPKTFRCHFAALEGTGGMRREGRREGKGGEKEERKIKEQGEGQGAASMKLGSKVSLHSNEHISLRTEQPATHMPLVTVPVT